MPDVQTPDLRTVLEDAETIAVVGCSGQTTRTSHKIARYMQNRGYRIVPVNPNYDEVLDETCYPDLTSIPAHVEIDIVNIFRRPEHVPPIVDEALDAFPDLQTVWMQIGVVNEAAAEAARARGVDVVMDRCPKIEYQRLFGELRMGGFNTGVISSKL